MSTTNSTSEPTLSAVATRTTYHILRRLHAPTHFPAGSSEAKPISDQVAYELVYEGLEAPSAQAAIRYFATGKPDGNHDKAIEGTYVAIPSRSFTEQTVKVETQTVVKLT